MDPIRDARLSEEPHKGDRSPSQIDRDRVLYSAPFRRLAGVTQVVSPGEGEVFHNRLPPSLKAPKAARRLAERLNARQRELVRAWGRVAPDVCGAAALPHARGPPPFGHIAEEE